MKILLTNRIAPDGTPRFAASHLGLFCLPMSQKGTPGLNELNVFSARNVSQATLAVVLVLTFYQNLPYIIQHQQ